MSETIANLAQKNARNAIQRVEALEKFVPQIVNSVNGAMNNVHNQLANAVEILDAVVKILGADAVADAVKEARTARETEQTAQAVKHLADLVAAGTIKPVETAAEGCLLVFKENRKDGTTGRSQYMAQQLQEKFRAEVLGKPVGTKLTSDDGSEFELSEVYEQVAPPELHVPASEAVVDATPQPSPEA